MLVQKDLIEVDCWADMEWLGQEDKIALGGLWGGLCGIMSLKVVLRERVIEKEGGLEEGVVF